MALTKFGAIGPSCDKVDAGVASITALRILSSFSKLQHVGYPLVPHPPQFLGQSRSKSCLKALSDSCSQLRFPQMFFLLIRIFSILPQTSAENACLWRRCLQKMHASDADVCGKCTWLRPSEWAFRPGNLLLWSSDCLLETCNVF